MMKKLFGLLAIGLMSIGAAHAADGRNSFGDGSKEDSYVNGEKAPNAPEAKETVKKRVGWGDRSKENTYVPGEKSGAPESKTTIKDTEQGSFDDGSPAE